MIVAYPHTVQYAGKRTRKGRMMITTWRQRGMAIVAMLTGLIIMVGVVVRLGEYGVCRDA